MIARPLSGTAFYATMSDLVRELHCRLGTFCLKKQAASICHLRNILTEEKYSDTLFQMRHEASRTEVYPVCGTPVAKIPVFSVKCDTPAKLLCFQWFRLYRQGPIQCRYSRYTVGRVRGREEPTAYKT